MVTLLSFLPHSNFSTPPPSSSSSSLTLLAATPSSASSSFPKHYLSSSIHHSFTKFRPSSISLVHEVIHQIWLSHCNEEASPLPWPSPWLEMLHSVVWTSPTIPAEAEVAKEQLLQAQKIRRWILALIVGVSMTLQAGTLPAMALSFNWFFGGQAEQKDPVEPFTLYGSIFKKYLVEQIVEGKVVARKKGFTASACVIALNSGSGNPELEAVPTKLKVPFDEEPSCAKGEGKTKEESCFIPCKDACRNSIKHHLTVVEEGTGFNLEASEREKAMQTCSSECVKQCIKPGKATSFLLPYRPAR